MVRGPAGAGPLEGCGARVRSEGGAELGETLELTADAAPGEWGEGVWPDLSGDLAPQARGAPVLIRAALRPIQC